MSLPPGFMDELRSRTSLVQVVGRKVQWEARKSNPGKGDMWSPCPFHHEKTASFHVDDQKGFYYCFGCHAKGDAINFVQETENVSFIEAVKILADEAGMPMPDRDPRAQEKADKHSQLIEVMELAVKFFRMSLNTGAASEARAYLERRGLSQETQDQFDIGFAPDGWQTLWDALKGRGVPDPLILEAGLAKPSNKGKAPYDVFRNRIMFPIRDARGRTIAFGGRAMDPNDNAKYLNSPETPLFDKGRNLYNHKDARAAAGKDQPLVVAEGYMDVIALASAGFDSSVAPLGTAVTENQLQLLWRMSAEPIVALDGDKAGIRAAMRLIDLALPLLEAGKSLRFAIMPEGKDPDDVIKSGGAKAMEAILDQAKPMVDLLWQREIQGKVFDSPERKATLDKALREKIKLIKDPSIRAHYGETIKDLRWQLFRPQRGGGGGKSGFKPRGKWGAPAAPHASTKASLLVSADDARQRHMREAVILASIIVTPSVLDEFEAGLENLTCAHEDHGFLRDLLLRQTHRGVTDLKSVVEDAMGPEALDFLMGNPHVRLAPPIRKQGDEECARLTISEELRKLSSEVGLSAEIAEAEENLTEFEDEAVTWRLSQAAEERDKAIRSLQEDSAEYVVGDNGASIDKDERAALDALMGKISFTKRRP